MPATPIPQKFEPGSKVRLRTGGPEMLVEPLPADLAAFLAGGVKCVWFDGADLKTYTFDPRLLEQVTEL